MVSASYFEWAFVGNTPNLSNGGLHLPYAEAELYQFEPPHASSGCKAAALGDSMDGCLSGPKKIVMKLHVSRGHASAHQLKRVLVDSIGAFAHLCGCGVGTD